MSSTPAVGLLTGPAGRLKSGASSCRTLALLFRQALVCNSRSSWSTRDKSASVVLSDVRATVSTGARLCHVLCQAPETSDSRHVSAPRPSLNNQKLCVTIGLHERISGRCGAWRLLAGLILTRISASARLIQLPCCRAAGLDQPVP